MGYGVEGFTEGQDQEVVGIPLVKSSIFRIIPEKAWKSMRNIQRHTKANPKLTKHRW